MSDQTRSPDRARLRATGRIAAAAAVLGAVVFICVNLISAQELRSARVDFTQQHLYSLSDGTRTLLANLKEPLRFRLFMSSELTKQAPQLAAFATRVRSMLDTYVAAAKGKIVLEVIDPRPFSEDEDRAVAFGIEGLQGQNGERLFFGLAATDSTSGRATIESFSPDRETFLEYDLTRLVSEVGRRGKPVVALLDGIGLGGNPAMRIPEQQVLVQMKQFFDVKPLSGEVEKLPEGTRVLMVVHPQNLTQRTLYTVDQWVLNGNAAIIFVDPFAENQFGPHGEGANAASTLDPLFKSWGVKFDTAHAIGDPDYALQTQREVDGRPVVSQNLPWIAVRGDGLAKDEAILNQLSAVVMTTAGSFETTKDSVTLRPLLKASSDAVLLDTAQASDRSGDPRRLLAGSTKSPQRPILAARLFGTIDTAFPDGPPKDANPPGATPDPPKPEDAASDTVKRSTKPLNVILVGDADMLMDRNWIRTQSMFGQRMAQAFANNGDFVINAIEQMAGGAALADLRGRGVAWRPFELIQKMEAEAESRYSAKEQELTQELKDTEQKLSQMPKAEGKSGEGGNDVLTPDQLKAIEGFRTQLLRVRSELRDVQFALRRDVDNLKNWVTAINVGIVPVGVAVVVLIFALRRPRRAVPKKSNGGAG